MIQTAHLSEAKRALLEKYLQGKAAQPSEAVAGIPCRLPDDAVPLSVYQEDLWARAQTAPECPPFFNESITIHRHGPLEVDILEQSLCEIFRRHEAWRTTFDVSRGQALQVIGSAPRKISLPVVDLRKLPEEMRESAMLRAAEEQAQVPFNLREGPLVRTKLVRLDDEHYQLFFTMHQLIVDGISVYNVLPFELVTLYEAFLKGKPSLLPALPIQYGDFAIWHRQWLHENVVESQLAYWRTQLAGGLPEIRWGKEGGWPSLRSYPGVIQPVSFSQGLSEGLKELSQNTGVTMFMVLLAAFNVLLRHYTGQDHITVGTFVAAGRKRTEVQQLLGYFLNPVALHSDLSGDPDFTELLQQVRRVTSEALTRDDVPIEWVLRELKHGLDRLSTPELRVMISLAPPTPQLQPGWDMTPMDVNSRGSRWELYLELAERPAGVIGRVQYNPEIFSENSILQMLVDLQSVLEAAIRDPKKRVSALKPSPFRRASRARRSCANRNPM